MAQHGVVARRQLLALGLTEAAVKQRLKRGRLHPLFSGVYAVGRPDVSQKGRWMAAVLACGPEAVLSDDSAAALYGIRHRQRGRELEVTVPPSRLRIRPEIIIHRRMLAPEQIGTVDGIPITSPITTLIHLATRLERRQLETAVNEADKIGLVDPEALREALDRLARHQRGVGALRTMLDKHSFVLTDSKLEQMFVPLALRAGLDLPLTRHRLNGFLVDFFWPDLGLVVETDGLTYHRTPAEQSRDRLRDQRHTAARLTCLRFTHQQVANEQDHVIGTLRSVVRQLRQSRL